MNDDPALPRCRPFEALPIRGEDGQPVFVLQDHTRLAPSMMAVSLPGYFAVLHMDGQHTQSQMLAAFEREFGAALPDGQLAELIRALDDNLLLDNPRARDAHAARVNAWHAAPARDNRERFPPAAELAQEMATMLASGRVEAPATLAGLVAPHLDYARGGPCYADAYAALRPCVPFDRYVILGTNHFGRSAGPVATTKDFQTPLGLVRTDAGLIERLERRLGRSLRDDEFDHAAEHSIELQVHLLQHVQPAPAFEIVPILCPDPCSADDGTVDLNALADALRTELDADGRRTLLIASADLSHVGQRFGEPEPTDAAFLARVEAHDRGLIELLEHGHDGQFVDVLRQVQNLTRICSVGCLYALRRALPGRPLRLLRYHQAVDFESETHVTCAAAVVL